MRAILMLEALHIRNLAVVEDVGLSFDHGLNVLTGSTGAGKSLILSAVNLLLGERGSARAIRAGKDRAVIEGVFLLGRPIVDTLLTTVPYAGSDRLTLRREIHRGGRSHAFINDRPCSLKQLQQVCAQLIEPHGQNEQLQLKYAENHVVYLDKLADNGDLLETYRDALNAFRAAESRRMDFEEKLSLLKEKRELLEHRIDEIDRAAIQPGEKGELEASIKILENSQNIFDTLSRASEAIYENETSAFNLISQERGRLSKIASFDEALQSLVDQLEGVEITLKESASEMRAYLGSLEFEPGRLAEMQERLAFLVGLERRYGRPLEEVLADCGRWKSELESIAVEGDERAKLRSESAGALDRVRAAAQRLTESRRSAAKSLDDRMTQELEQLMMPGARFRTDLAPEVEPESPLVIDGQPVKLRSDGVDRVVFYVRTNPGEAEGSVSDVASSGELSRIALALRRIVSLGREGSVLVFDEVDAGVGADLGETIASRLVALAQVYQIICITHMPQIAARARRHLVVTKSSARGRTFAHVEEVAGQGRLREIARMLGGAHGSQKRLALAEEMLRIRKGKPPPNVRP